jgi:hypothetical protein
MKLDEPSGGSLRKDVVQGPNVRHLEGEIHLSPDLQPSCDFQLFQIEVLTSYFFIQMN